MMNGKDKFIIPVRPTKLIADRWGLAPDSCVLKWLRDSACRDHLRTRSRPHSFGARLDLPYGRHGRIRGGARRGGPPGRPQETVLGPGALQHEIANRAAARDARQPAV